MCVIPKCCKVYTDLAASAPPMNMVSVTFDGFSVFAASDISDILSRMCSSLTYSTLAKCESFIISESSDEDPNFPPVISFNRLEAYTELLVRLLTLKLLDFEGSVASERSGNCITNAGLGEGNRESTEVDLLPFCNA
nr:hypothetical protein Itr_chr06CG09930 [Ipomoea trifida]